MYAARLRNLLLGFSGAPWAAFPSFRSGMLSWFGQSAPLELWPGRETALGPRTLAASRGGGKQQVAPKAEPAKCYVRQVRHESGPRGARRDLTRTWKSLALQRLPMQSLTHSSTLTHSLSLIHSHSLTHSHPSTLTLSLILILTSSLTRPFTHTYLTTTRRNRQTSQTIIRWCHQIVAVGSAD